MKRGESKLQRKLDVVFFETTGNDPFGIHRSDLRRFVAKSLDSGNGWGVFDRKKLKFLSPKELAKLSLVALRQPFAN